MTFEMTIENFIAIKNDLRWCPICACRLIDHQMNTAIRVCPNHGNVFSIHQTLDEKSCMPGYRVEVDLAAG